jgi:hypothetical protein
MSRLQPGFPLGDYRLGQALWPLRIADAYRADGPNGSATIYVVHAKLAANPQVRDAIVAGTRAAAALPEHKHRVRTLAAGLTGDILWIAAEEVDGQLVRDLLLKKRQAGSAGLGARATGNLIAGIADALAETHHGALASESVVVNRTGRVRVIDLALGAGTIAAMRAGLVPSESSLAPEMLDGTAPNGPADVYAIGAMLYEALVGSPLERGGARPSDVVEGVTTQIDEIVARACHRDAGKRFGRADVLGEVVTEALNKGGAVKTAHVPKIAAGPALGQQVSLAAEIASPTASNSTLDRELARALGDTTEKWLITKGRLDYGPFSLADVITQIEKGDIVAGNMIMDKDTGARGDVGEHSLLGPMVEAAKQARDDARRAQAEVAVQKADKKRGALLYTMIAAGALGFAAIVYFVVLPAMKSSDDSKKIETVSGLGGATLKVTFSEPKRPPPSPKRPGGHRPGGGGGPGGKNVDEGMSLDLSDESDEGSDALNMNVVYGVYSRYGAQLGGCMASTGEHSANIYININGPSGRVQAVRINGKTAGPLYNCLSRVLRSMQFPTIHGPRTRAEFDISV